MKIISEQDVVNKGLDFVRQYDLFQIDGNHYFPYPKVLQHLKSTYHIDTKYFGNSDQSSTTTIFNRKTPNEIEKEKQDKDLNYQIALLDKKFNVKISYHEIQNNQKK